MITALSIPLFESITQHNYNNIYYDFHNDYNCTSINLENSLFTLTFTKISDASVVVLIFHNTVFTKLNLRILQEPDADTIDMIYRGRFELDNKLSETDGYGRGYFYIAFCDETSIELWAESIALAESTS